ncbi:hydrogenase assembly protein HupF [Aestuariivirga litoralis]|uniref:Hydrogenase maturation factor HypC n=1 Tax=Aestuariivirga litoralis TaxID=2650924 RepID=A0A2W2C8C7_9HYPH|nr:HypC/HybG/HupF family hydrogenase formation chaperone [Aestuariivirga litoralis]PZF76463.1 hydrogenase assembly protein HupF [Aestuariivirga litoralis]
MCLAVPAEVVSLDLETQTAVVALGQVKKQISIALLESVTVGDFVLVHVGFALNRISPEEAARTLQLMAEAGLLGEEEAA